jgi:hypothetical protein
MCFNTERSDNKAATLNQISVTLAKPLSFYYVRLSNYVVPNTWDNIITGYNDKFTVTEPANANNTVTIAQGAYNITSLAAALKTALDASSPGGAVYTVTVDNASARLSISCTVAIAYNPSLSTMGSVLGFAASDTASGLLIRGSRCFNVSANEIYIVCNLVRPIKINNGDLRILEKVVVDKNFGNRLTNSNIDPEFVPIDGNQFNQVEISLVFADGSPVPMRSGWSIDLDFIAMLA